MNRTDIFRSFLWVAGSKLTGFGRDLLLIYLFGLSSSADSMFIGLTIAMFAQLVGYYFAINFLLFYGDSIRKSYFSRGAMVGAIALTATLIYALGLPTNAPQNVEIFFVALSPIALLLGMRIGLLVLAGYNDAQPRNMTVQNIAILLFLILAVRRATELALMSWLVALLCGLVCVEIEYRNRKSKVHTTESIKYAADKQKRIRFWREGVLAFLHPATVFAAVLLERFFYSQTEGMVAVVKILETLATSAVFVTQVLILNRALARISQQIGKNPLPIDFVRTVLKNSVLRSLVLGEGIYFSALTFGFAVIVLWPSSLNMLLEERVISVFALIYGAYAASVILREHGERLAIISGKSPDVTMAGLVVVFLTWVLNSVSIEWAPLSVLLVSVSLALAKALILYWRSIRDLYEQ